MSKENKKSVGRPPVLKDEKLLEKYISIYFAYHFMKVPVWELQKEHNLSYQSIRRALDFVNKQFIKLPNKQVLQGAIYSIETRMNKIAKRLEIELNKKEPPTRSVVELNRELREDSRDLMKLQNLMKEKFELDLGGSTKEILEILSKKK